MPTRHEQVSMASTSQRELERFFAEVTPRLDTAQALDDELDRQLARRFNVLRYLRTDEMGFSRMIKDLLDPAGDHGQGAAFLKLLTDKLDFAKGVNLDDAKVRTERQIDGRRRIDIAVEIDDKHCLAIENKSNFAGDQERQVEDDLDWLKREYKHSLLIYLSPTGRGPSEASVSAETIEKLDAETARRFVVMPCHSTDVSDDRFSLVDWLADCRRNCDVDRLRWYLRETETYCRQRYGENAVTNTKKNAVKKFLRGEQKYLATALAIYESWPELAHEIKRRFLKSIRNEIWNDLRGDTYIQWDYGPKPYQSYIYIYHDSWRPYVVGGQKLTSCLYMQAERKEDADWYIGVWSPATNEVSGHDRERREKLHQELGKMQMRQHRYYPCWKEVDEKYRDWNPLIPQMDEEVREGGGEITNYFVGKFKEIADQVIPIIDSIDGR